MSSSLARRIRLEVPVFGQQEAECGITTLKSALWYLGRHSSATGLARLAGANPDGIDHGALVRVAQLAGVSVFARAEGSIRELRWFLSRGLTPIVGWWSREPGDAHYDQSWSLAERRARDCGHYSVVCGMDANRIQMMDPQWEVRRGRLRILGRQWMPTRQFRRVWYDTDSSAYRKVTGWYMVPHLSRDTFTTQIGGGKDYPGSASGVLAT